MVKCCVEGCPVNDKTSLKLPLFNKVHPNAKGKFFKVTSERRNLWKDVLRLDENLSASLLVCCRHFSIAQYNEIRLNQGCKYNILQSGAFPDMNLFGTDNDYTHLIVYEESDQETCLSENEQTNQSEEEAQEGNLSVSATETSSESSRKLTDEAAISNDVVFEGTSESVSNDSHQVNAVSDEYEFDLRSTAAADNDSSHKNQYWDMALGKSRTYELFCNHVYMNRSFPDYSTKAELFYAKNICELVPRQVLKDAQSAFKRLEEEVSSLRKQNFHLQSELLNKSKVQEKLDKSKNEQLMVTRELKKRFSQPQIDRILHQKNSHWNESDFRKAITLLGISPKAFNVTRELLCVPLPSRSAVKQLLAKIKMPEGVLTGVLDLMQAAGQSFTEFERQVSICFDEVQLSNRFPVVYNSTTDQVQGPHKLMQVGVISGIFCSYSNPVFYQHSCPVTKKVLFEVLQAVHKAGFRVRVLVCDLGFDNQRLLKALEVDDEKPYFSHPETKDKVFVWADPPHCEKLLRNHVLDHGINVDPESSGENVASILPLQALVSETSHTDVPAHPLRQEHLNVQGSERQRCNLTRQLLSCEVATALESLAEHKDYAEKAATFMATAEVCRVGQLFAGIFGVTADLDDGSMSSLFVAPELLPYGRKLQTQEAALKKLYETVGKWRVYAKNKKLRSNLLEFQKGIRMACRGLQMLYEDLISIFPGQKVEILTTHLTQDVVERLFGLFRTLFGPNQRPDSVEGGRRLKSLIIGDSTGLVSKKSNVGFGVALEKISLNILSLKPMRACCTVTDDEDTNGTLTETEAVSDVERGREDGAPSDEEQEEHDTDEDEESEGECAVESEESDGTEKDKEESHVTAVPVDWSPLDGPDNKGYKTGMIQIAEAIAGRLGGKHPELISQSKSASREKPLQDWLPLSLRKHCAPASPFLLKLITKCDTIFREINKNSISKQKEILARLTKLAMERIPQLPISVAMMFFRKRLRIRCDNINLELWGQRKRKMPKSFQADDHSRAAKRRKLYS